LFDAAAADRHSAVPLDQKDALNALKAFETAARLEPQVARVNVSLGFAYYQLENYQQALKYFERGRTMNPKVENAFLGIASTYVQLGEYRTAEDSFRAGLGKEPDNARIRFNLGVVCLRRKNPDCALTQYNYLKIQGHSLAKKLFTIFRNRLVDASRLSNKL
jgi:Tfp pilus assembly protein PilF